MRWGCSGTTELIYKPTSWATARVRAPGTALDAADQAELTQLLQRLERATARLKAPLRLAGE